MNQIAVNLAKQFEGYRRKPYVCPAGFLTAGYGHAFKKGETVRELSVDEAGAILGKDLTGAERATLRLCPSLISETEGRQGAIIDFVFNLGAGRLQTSTLRRRINQGNWLEVKKELNKWVFGGGKKLPGLVLRRLTEASLI